MPVHYDGPCLLSLYFSHVLFPCYSLILSASRFGFSSDTIMESNSDSERGRGDSQQSIRSRFFKRLKRPFKSTGINLPGMLKTDRDQSAENSAEQMMTSKSSMHIHWTRLALSYSPYFRLLGTPFFK